MTTILIVGILVAVAVPSYQQYIVNAKITEAYTFIDSIGKAQITFFSNYDEFHDLAPSPVGLDMPMTFADNQGWDKMGYPIAVGTNLLFVYRARAGKTDSAGTQLVDSPKNTELGVDWHFTDVSNATILGGRYYNPPPSQCNVGITTPQTLGITTTPTYDWVMISAVGDLNGNKDTKCTAVARLMEASPATGRKPKFLGGFILVNKGD